MPLVFGGHSISVINGPREMNVLVQNFNNQHLNNNTIILFGETHTLDFYQPCEEYTNCDELITDFVRKLNNFARFIRTEFYIEDFLEYQYLRKNIPAVQQQLIEKEIIRDKNAVLKYLETTHFPLKEQREMFKASLRLRNFLESNMTAMKILYNGCFYKNIKNKPNVCLYNNIIWQYADVRTSNLYSLNNLPDYDNFLNNSQGYSILLNAFYNNVVFTEDTFDNAFVKQTKFKLIDVLIILQLTLYDLDEYVRRLMRTKYIKKQRDKINPHIRGLFSDESFIELFKVSRLQVAGTNDNVYDENIHRKLIQLIDLFIKYLNPESDAGQREEYLIQINSMEKFTLDEWKKSEWFHSAIEMSVLDVYFILRINKENTIGESTQKLVLGYFGSNHLSNITYYLCVIINTHQVLTHYESEDGDIFRINITDNIDLNKIMNLGGIKTKKRRIKKYRNKHTKTKTQKQNKKRINFKTH
jgi:hypothetical protein